MFEENWEKLRRGINDGDAKATEVAAKEAIGKGLSPIEANKGLTNPIRQHGEKFGRMEIFLSDLMMASLPSTPRLTQNFLSRFLQNWKILQLL